MLAQPSSCGKGRASMRAAGSTFRVEPLRDGGHSTARRVLLTHLVPDRSNENRTLASRACQGAFCGVRMAAHLYDRGRFSGGEGLDGLREFIRGRWKGLAPVLWGDTLAQESLQEAMHCGLFGLDL